MAGSSAALPSPVSLAGGSVGKDGAPAVGSERRVLLDIARNYLEAAKVIRQLDGLTDNYRYYLRVAPLRIQQARAIQ